MKYCQLIDFILITEFVNCLDKSKTNYKSLLCVDLKQSKWNFFMLQACKLIWKILEPIKTQIACLFFIGWFENTWSIQNIGFFVIDRFENIWTNQWWDSLVLAHWLTWNYLNQLKQTLVFCILAIEPIKNRDLTTCCSLDDLKNSWTNQNED